MTSASGPCSRAPKANMNQLLPQAHSLQQGRPEQPGAVHGRILPRAEFRAIVKLSEEHSTSSNTSSAAPLVQDNASAPAAEEAVHYGTHFTNMFMRNYPDRITTKGQLEENWYPVQAADELRTMEGRGRQRGPARRGPECSSCLA
jgi:hypothetical protein